MFTEYVWNKTKLGFTIRATRFNYNNINCMSEKSWKIWQNICIFHR